MSVISASFTIPMKSDHTVVVLHNGKRVETFGLKIFSPTVIKKKIERMPIFHSLYIKSLNFTMEDLDSRYEKGTYVSHMLIQVDVKTAETPDSSWMDWFEKKEGQ
jgi:hypothetical protein